MHPSVRQPPSGTGLWLKAWVPGKAASQRVLVVVDHLQLPLAALQVNRGLGFEQRHFPQLAIHTV